MSDLQQFLYMKRNRFSRPSLVLLAVLFGVMLLFVAYGTASAQRDNSVARGFTGVVTSVDRTDNYLTVESKRAVFQLRVSDTTMINNPPDQDVGQEGLPTETGFRIAGLVDRKITDDDGNVTPELLTAQKIIVIPVKATRSHRRTVASDKQGDNLTTLDDEANRKELTGRGAGIENGDTIILLVQRAGRGGIGEKVRGLFNAKIVDDRLDRLSKAEADDPLKTALLAELRDKRDDVHEKRLRKTADNAETDFRDLVLARVRAIQESKEARHKRAGIGREISECARSIAGRRANSIKTLDANQRQRVTDECLRRSDSGSDDAPVIQITSPSSGAVVSPNDVVTVTAEAKDDVGVVSVTFSVAGSDVATLTAAPYTVEVTIPTNVSPVAIKATAVDADGNEGSDDVTLRVAPTARLGLRITSPVISSSGRGPGTRPSTVSGSAGAIAEGETIIIRADVTGTGAITMVFTVSGVDQAPVLAPPYLMTYFVPFNSSAAPPQPLRITATATDGSGDIDKDSVSVDVIRKPTVVNVKITDPPADAKVTGGDRLVIRVQTDNDSGIAFVTFSVDGVETVDTTAPFTHTYTAPRKSTAAAVSDVPPNVFVGKATLDGVPVPDGTVVVAWIAGSDSTNLIIKVTAAADSGETGSASLSLPVSSPINVGEGIVKHGSFKLNAAQPRGQRFTGKTITFTIGGKDAPQTDTWRQGDATILNLTAN